MQSSNSPIKIASIRSPCHHYVAEQGVRRRHGDIVYCSFTVQLDTTAFSQIADYGLSDFYG